MARDAKRIAAAWLAMPVEQRDHGSMRQLQADLTALLVENGEDDQDELSSTIILRVHEALHPSAEWPAKQLAECLNELLAGEAP